MIKRFIKTECGLSEYRRLEKLSKDSLASKIRLYVFILVGSIRDLFKN